MSKNASRTVNMAEGEQQAGDKRGNADGMLCSCKHGDTEC